MATARDQILSATCTLMEAQGYHATGLSQIVKESGTPKGSLYYYFPEGKESIAEEAIRHVTGLVLERIRTHLAGEPDPAQAFRSFAHTIAHHVESSGFQAGSPLTIVAMETATTSPRLNLVCREAYEQMREAFAGKLTTSGLSQAQADDLSMVILSMMEGAIITSRTYHTGDPLRRVGDAIAALVAPLKTGN